MTHAFLRSSNTADVKITRCGQTVRLPRTTTRCAATAGKGGNTNPVLVKAIETALQAVSKVLQDTDKKRKSRLQSGVVEVEAVAAKLISFKAGGSNDRLIKAPHLPGRQLGKYLALPLESYSLLDPRWISRSPEDPTLFQLAIPLQELVGLALQPCISIRVDVDPANGQVNFHANRFSLGVPKFDSDFKLDMKAKLQHRPVAEAFVMPSFDFWRRAAASQQEEKPASSRGPPATAAEGSAPEPRASVPAVMPGGSGVLAAEDAQEHGLHGPAAPLLGARSTAHAPDAVDAAAPEAVPAFGAAAQADDSPSGSASGRQEEGEGSSHEKSSAQLWCSVEVEIEALAPYPLAVVPRPLLNLTASLITKFTIQQLLPAFLQLLSIDYERWALGKVQARTQSAGSLLSIVGPRGGSASLGHNIIVSSSVTADGRSEMRTEGGVRDASAGSQDVVVASAVMTEEPSVDMQESNVGERAKSSKEAAVK